MSLPGISTSSKFSGQASVTPEPSNSIANKPVVGSISLTNARGRPGVDLADEISIGVIGGSNPRNVEYMNSAIEPGVDADAIGCRDGEEDPSRTKFHVVR